MFCSLLLLEMVCAYVAFQFIILLPTIFFLLLFFYTLFYRVSWNVELVPKMIYGGIKRTLHVDGISEYYLDRESGLITEHKVRISPPD